MSEWRSVLEQVDAGAERIVATLRGLSDEEMRAPSGLPGWTRGHVATHIARNADGLWNLLEWARTGVEIPQYPSLAARNADVGNGATRDAGTLAEDVRTTAARFSDQARSLPDKAWDVQVRAMTGWAHPAWYTIYRRWHEVEAHHADLAAGYGPADWPEAYVQWALTSTLESLEALPRESRAALDGHRLVATDTGDAADLSSGPDAGPDGAEISGSGRALLGWLSGRSSGEGLVVRPEAPLPVPPPWPHAPGGF